MTYPDVAALQFRALGGTCELYAVGPREPLADTAAWILGLHRQLTRFEPDSELSRFNARAGEWVEVSPVLEELLREALAAYETSGGLVHCGVLPTLAGLGYDDDFDRVRGRYDREIREGVADRWRSSEPPTWCDRCGEVARDPCHSARHPCHPATSASIGGTTAPEEAPVPFPALPDLLSVRPGHARLASGASVDLGGIAKGWVADRAVERLGPNAVANCAGDLMAIGPGPASTAGAGWPVGFGGETVLLHRTAAATSGTAKRRWGDGLHHLIDPRTGRPATSDLTEVSVLARSGSDAEVLAKAAFILGSGTAPSFLEGRALGWALS